MSSSRNRTPAAAPLDVAALLPDNLMDAPLPATVSAALAAPVSDYTATVENLKAVQDAIVAAAQDLEAENMATQVRRRPGRRRPRLHASACAKGLTRAATAASAWGAGGG